MAAAATSNNILSPVRRRAETKPLPGQKKEEINECPKKPFHQETEAKNQNGSSCKAF